MHRSWITGLDPAIVGIKIFETDKNGAIEPNPIFHRPWDKLHSRCIEYPFAAYQLDKFTGESISSYSNQGKKNGIPRVLDVGTAKADPIWVRWLVSLPIKVYLTDYDLPEQANQFKNFYRADLRDLPFPDNCMDQVLAISVIEHIGLDTPQVNSIQFPVCSNTGDLDAVREMVRVLKPGGELVMTFPLGDRDSLILGGEARSYSLNGIQHFEQYAQSIVLDYYEYQYVDNEHIYIEYIPPQSACKNLLDAISTASKVLKNRLHELGKVGTPIPQSIPKSISPTNIYRRERDGVVTWRRVPIESTQATHYKHVDGVLCGVWRKK